MKTWLRQIMPAIAVALPVVMAFLVCLPVWAATSQTSDGAVSEALSKQMYCSVGSLLEGDIGLLIGLVLVFLGIWGLVQGAKMVAVVPIIIIGSLVTALPSLIESSFAGLGSLLVEAKISSKTFTPPDCSASSTTNETDLEKAYSDPNTGQYYPSRGTPPATVVPNSSGSPDDRDGL